MGRPPKLLLHIAAKEGLAEAPTRQPSTISLPHLVVNGMRVAVLSQCLSAVSARAPTYQSCLQVHSSWALEFMPVRLLCVLVCEFYLRYLAVKHMADMLVSDEAKSAAADLEPPKLRGLSHVLAFSDLEQAYGIHNAPRASLRYNRDPARRRF